MRRTGQVLWVVSFVFVFGQFAFAQLSQDSTDATTQQPAVEQPAVEQPAVEQPVAPQTQVKHTVVVPAVRTAVKQEQPAAPPDPALVAAENAGAAKLQAQTWVVYVYPQGRNVSHYDTDTLTFTPESITSGNLSAKGYSAPHYAMSITGDQSPAWTAIMHDAKDNSAMWRGEIHGDTMVGILILQNAAGAMDRLAFSTFIPNFAPPQTGKKR